MATVTGRARVDISVHAGMMRIRICLRMGMTIYAGERRNVVRRMAIGTLRPVSLMRAGVNLEIWSVMAEGG